MGLSAAANTSKEIIERGGSNEQAFWGGLAAGTAELVFERFSVENLLKPKDIRGWKAALDNVKQVALAGAGGFLSGVGMGGGKAALDYALTQGQTQDTRFAAPQADASRVDAGEGTAVEAQKTATERVAGNAAIDANPATHTPEQMAVIKEYQGAVDKDILNFIERWQGLKDQNYRKKVRVDIAPVDSRTVQDVKAVIGVDVSDFTGHSLSGNALEHIESRHGESGKADHSMADPSDIARIGYVLKHYDSVEALRTNDGRQILSGEYFNKDGSRAPMVRFQKRVNGTYYVVEAVPDSAARELRVISAYMQKGSDGTGQELTYHKSDPQLTSETHLDAHTIASEPSIPQSAAEVNPEAGDGMENSVGAAAAGFTGDKERGFSQNLASDAARHKDVQPPGIVVVLPDLQRPPLSLAFSGRSGPFSLAGHVPLYRKVYLRCFYPRKKLRL